MSAMTITTDAQAEAVAISAEKLWMFIDFICSRNLESILGQDLLQRYNDDHDALRTAISAYEAQKAASIVLTPCEMARLQFYSFDRIEREEAEKTLISKGIMDVAWRLEPAGRAYLAAQKPREMQCDVCGSKIIREVTA